MNNEQMWLAVVERRTGSPMSTVEFMVVLLCSIVIVAMIFNLVDAKKLGRHWEEVALLVLAISMVPIFLFRSEGWFVPAIVLWAGLLVMTALLSLSLNYEKRRRQDASS